MPKIHITLVGGQPTPVYQGIIHSKPDIVILVCSKMSIEQAENIKNELTRSQDNTCQYRTCLINDSDISIMKSDIDKLFLSLSQEEDLSINLSGGMKIWSVLFYKTFINRELSDIYCIGQNGELFDIINERTEKVAFDMDTQFRLLGQKIKSYTSLEEYDEEDNDALNIILKLFRSSSHDIFKKLTSEFYKKYCGNATADSSIFNKQLSHDINNDSISWQPDDNSFILNIRNNEYILSSRNIRSLVLNTGWFEYYVALKLAKIYGKENIRMNCKFANAKDRDKNEVDVIVKTPTKLMFVECKTQVHNSTDVDKFNSVVRNYGGLGSKAFFVTYNKMTTEANEKCNDYHIKTSFIYQPHLSLIESEKHWKNTLKDIEKSWNV